ncbi:YecA family protein [Sandaracinus amylolyticus]|uniref:SEC-C motif domain protein n=1 Tax=Sandaracinus amylolyticus TaxID=927083 RepID=A0A0F6YI44_9BACT|nr:SEC-C domain-containing protein [Sandaracinus amylolyticus]AKF06578.1 hypothetical protein DB32_003727 [Sandaracinus amylolyticus]
MGHAAHFLRRLDRVSDAHVELALTLYRDADLLRAVLDAARIPEGASRVALSLEDPHDGPFVVVTREGRFVTCLGKGMRPGDLPVVSRERLDVGASRVQRMRDELAHLRWLRDNDGEGEAARVLVRMQQRGPRVGREDAAVLARVQPIIAGELQRIYLELARTAREAFGRVAMLRLDRLSDDEGELVLAYGDLVWGATHLSLFVDPGDLLEDDDPLTEAVQRGVFAQAQLQFMTGTLCHAMRALWTLKRNPRASLARLKRMSGPVGRAAPVFREMGLGIVACSSQKLRAEATKALTKPLRDAGGHVLEEQDLAHGMGGFVRELAIDRPEASDAALIENGRLFAARCWHRTRDVSDEQVAAVSEDVARIAYGAVPHTWLAQGNGEAIMHVAIAIPFLARASAEELFLPNEWADRMLPARSIAEVTTWLAPHLRECGVVRRTAKRAEPKIRRNELCRCGSGRKHKRCCALRAAA